MSGVVTQLEAYALSLRRVLEALDSGANPEHLLLLGDEADAQCRIAREALQESSPSERAAMAPQLAQLRAWAAVANARCTGEQASISARLGDVQRTRQTLSALAEGSTGDSCDVAG